MRKESEVLEQLTQWAQDNDNVRCMVLTSSRVDPSSKPDTFSDYDVEIYVKDKESFMNDDWLSEFGKVMVRWPLKPTTTFSEDWITRLIHFDDYLRIDWQITSKNKIEPNQYDGGYKVLIDKDELTKDLNDPTYSEYYIKKPTQDEFITLVNEFFWDATYVPKCLWRDELYFAKSMQNSLHFDYLQKMLEWYIAMRHNWEVNTKVRGRDFKKYLDQDVWKEVESTYSGADLEDSWQAFYNTLNLFKRLATAVAEELGYKYPQEVDKKVSEYCLRAKEF